MTAKEYLSQLPKLRCYIRSLEESYEVQQARATQRTKRLSEVQVQTSREIGRQEDAAVDMTITGQKIEKAIKACVQLEQEALDLINSLSDNRYRTVLNLRYINGRSWEYIAENMSYGYRHVTRLHGEALQAFEHVLVCPSDS